MLTNIIFSVRVSSSHGYVASVPPGSATALHDGWTDSSASVASATDNDVILSAMNYVSVDGMRPNQLISAVSRARRRPPPRCRPTTYARNSSDAVRMRLQGGRSRLERRVRC